MNNRIEYAFAEASVAYRFLNTVNNMALPDGHVRYGRDDCHVEIEYAMRSDGFDDTLSQLDDLASQFEGQEAR